MKPFTFHLLTYTLIVALLYSCNFQKPVHTRKTHSYGFQHENHIYFLLDYRVWQEGRRFWFILPFKLPNKIIISKVNLYRYEPEIDKIEKLGNLDIKRSPSTSLGYGKITEHNDKIIFLYNAGYDENFKLKKAIFIWDTKKEIFVDTGYQNPVSTDSEIYKKFFSEYKSPRSDNPGIIGFSKLRNEILQHLTIEDYDLPKSR